MQVIKRAKKNPFFSKFSIPEQHELLSLCLSARYIDQTRDTPDIAHAHLNIRILGVLGFQIDDEGEGFDFRILVK